MFLTVKIEASKSEVDSAVSVVAPFRHISCEVRGAELYYTRLPLSYSAEQIVLCMYRQNYSIIASCEGNFTLVLVLTTKKGKSVTLNKDRFNSQRTLFTENDNNIVISSSPKHFPIEKDNINHDAMFEALSSRISTQHVLQKNVDIVPLNYGLHFNGKRLDLIEVAKDELKVSQSAKTLGNDDALALIKRSLKQTYQVLDSETNNKKTSYT